MGKSSLEGRSPSLQHMVPGLGWERILIHEEHQHGVIFLPPGMETAILLVSAGEGTCVLKQINPGWRVMPKTFAICIMEISCIRPCWSGETTPPFSPFQLLLVKPHLANPLCDNRWEKGLLSSPQARSQFNNKPPCFCMPHEISSLKTTKPRQNSSLRFSRGADGGSDAGGWAPSPRSHPPGVTRLPLRVPLARGQLCSTSWWGDKVEQATASAGSNPSPDRWSRLGFFLFETFAARYKSFLAQKTYPLPPARHRGELGSPSAGDALVIEDRKNIKIIEKVNKSEAAKENEPGRAFCLLGKGGT